MRTTSDRKTPSADPRRTPRPGDPERILTGTTVLGRYTIGRFLGEGSNARVYIASQTGDPNPVVVKLVKDHIRANPRFRQFFDAEVKSMARFAHPYAVRLLDAAYDTPLGPCLVLDYIPGVTLEAVLQRHRRLPVDRVARLLGPLCHALQAAHAAGIVHRDLKPANLMVVKAGTPEESLKVMDFGFAGFTAKPYIQLAELTGRGSIYACGTPAYVSPEMIRGDPVDGRADLYAVGVMLYEMLTGRLPFERDTQDEMVAAHVRDYPPRFYRVGVADIPAAVEECVHLALSKYPNERQQTARDLAVMFGKAFGIDLWEETAPAGYAPPPPAEEIVECTPAPLSGVTQGLDDPYLLSDRFEAMMPERLAAVKLRGFIDDLKGTVVTSEPGLVRFRLGLPPGWAPPAPKKESTGKTTRLFSWIATAGREPAFPKGQEPIELDLQMEKSGPQQVSVLITFRPLKWYLPDNPKKWQARCEEVYTALRRYLMAQ